MTDSVESNPLTGQKLSSCEPSMDSDISERLHGMDLHEAPGNKCSSRDANLSTNNLSSGSDNLCDVNHSCGTEPAQFAANMKSSDSETLPFKTDSRLTNESDDEFMSASDGSESDDDFIPPSDFTLSEKKDVSDKFCPGQEDDDDKEKKDREDFQKLYGDLDESNEDKEDKEEDISEKLEERKKLEESLSNEELEERKAKSQLVKGEGNDKFRNGDFDEAIDSYTEALSLCPLTYEKDRSILFSNRAACKMKKELYADAIKDSSSALELHPQYMKALLRRAELYEKTEKLDEALQDYTKIVEMDPSQHMARAACMKLGEQIKDRNEKMKDEMMGKLKDLGNMVLRPFGLSTNNFQMQQDPSTGSYSVNFTQSPPNNGS